MSARPVVGARGRCPGRTRQCRRAEFAAAGRAVFSAADDLGWSRVYLTFTAPGGLVARAQGTAGQVGLVRRQPSCLNWGPRADIGPGRTAALDAAMMDIELPEPGVRLEQRARRAATDGYPG